MCILLLLSSPFLFVFGDDRVILYTGAVDNTGNAGNTWMDRGASLGFELGIYL